jgi:GNAT superfamily N-acetyltransferase
MAYIEFLPQSPHSEHATLLLAMASSSGRDMTSLPLEDFDEDNDGVFLVAYVNGQPTGCSGYRLSPADPSGDTAEFALMYVRPGSRSSGLVRSIMLELERLAVHDGFRRAVVRVADDQLVARALVEITGYRRELSLDDGRTGPIYGKPLLSEEDSQGRWESEEVSGA